MRKKMLLAVAAALAVSANVAIAASVKPALPDCPGGKSCRDAGQDPDTWCEENHAGCNLCQFNPFGPHCASDDES